MSLVASYLLKESFNNHFNKIRVSESQDITSNCDNSVNCVSGSCGLQSKQTFSTTSEMSWFVAAKPSDTGSYHILDMRTSDNYGIQPLYIYEDGRIQFHVAYTSGNKFTPEFKGSLVTNKWNYIIITLRNNVVSCYLNGQKLSRSDEGPTLAPESERFNNLPLYVGCRFSDTSNSSFDGTISDCRIYNHCLSESEILSLSSDLVCHYTFDQQRSSRIIVDTSKNGFNSESVGSSTATGYVANVTNIGRNTAVFAGSNAFIRVPSALKLVPPFTYSIWATMGDWKDFAKSDMRILSCTDSGGFNIEPLPEKDAQGNIVDGNVQFAIYDSVLKYQNNISTKKLSALHSGWHLFTATLSSDYVFTVYIDGKTQDEWSRSVPDFAYNTSNYFYLGAEANEQNDSSNPFQGCLDDFRMYRRALTAAEVKDLYQTRSYIYLNGTLKTSGFLSETTDYSEVGKDGNCYTVELVEQFFDKKLSDGSCWTKIFYHNINYGYFSDTTTDPLTTKSFNKYSKLSDLNSIAQKYDGKYEFMLEYPHDYPGKYNRWRQTSNPFIQTTPNNGVTGYSDTFEGAHIDFRDHLWGGLEYNGSSSLADGSVKDGTWYYAIGQKSAWEGGIPGPHPSIRCVDTALWVRVNDDSKFNKEVYFANDNKIYCNIFIEE